MPSTSPAAPPITGSTRLAGVIGYPVRYSLSPALHNAAYAAMGIDARYLALPVEPDAVGTAVAALVAFDAMGASVTIPHKEAVIAHLDQVDPVASALRAVNCIAVDGGRTIGYNTDGDGFVRSLRADLRFDPAGRRALVVGAGGAARAIVAALARAGATDVVVLNRSQDRAAEVVAIAGDPARVGSMDDVARADLVVNATPVGMAGVAQDQVPLDVSLLGTQHVVVDIVYHPLQTRLLAGANERGATTANGLGMLLHQAALQIELWTGAAAPVPAMRAALLAAIEH